MADWINNNFDSDPLVGLLAPASDAQLLAGHIVNILQLSMPIRLVLAPFNWDTGRIGTEVPPDSICPGERFVVLNDVTTRGQCVSKLGKIVTDHGGILAGMMVFARRDSGQFPLMDDLMADYPFYFTTDLNMPQWEPDHCPLCPRGEPLLSWRDIPEL